jgi:hypothetical protein
MRTAYRCAGLFVLLCAGISAGFGWGNLTHVFFATYPGVRVGPLNLNEMYGAGVPTPLHTITG